MSRNLNPHLVATDPPAVMEAFRWLDATTFSDDTPLINVSQAAPTLPPPEPLRRAMADIILHDTSAHLYGPDLGLPELRDELARHTGSLYGGSVNADQVAITAGCSQAFSSAVASLAAAGDQIILPSPWYFNHEMLMQMNGITPVALPTGEDLLPDPEQAKRLITDKTRAIVLVTPNNPGGVEYPAPLMRAFFELARSHDIALVVDETYRDFHSQNGAPHGLFTDPDWADTLIHLYSFSKAYRLTGHRVGAMITAQTRITEVEKYLDSTTICANQIGQRAALWGMQNLSDWLAQERADILDRKAAITDVITALDGWTLKGCGAYFAYAETPFDMPSDQLARHLLQSQGVLALPGTMFTPKGDPAGLHALRFAFANIDRAGITQLHTRLQNLTT